MIERERTIELVPTPATTNSATPPASSAMAAVVQLRQKHVSHKQTFFYLEQIILRHDAAARAIIIKQADQGIDFFFAKRSHAVKFIEFLGNVAPITTSSKQLLSHDGPKSNNYKYAFSLVICPVCREDLICLSPRVAVSLGNLGPLVICTKVSNNIALLDPFTLRHYSFLDADEYVSASFKSLRSSRHLVKYLVCDVEVVSSEVNVDGSKYTLADAVVASVSDFGKLFCIRTHIGHLLNPGDYALGYDLTGANSADVELAKYKGLVFPEVILIKKCYEENRQKMCGNPRSWKLKSLCIEVQDSKGKVEQAKMNLEYEKFLRDLEENPELRSNISLYHNEEYQPFEMASITDGEDIPSVPEDELLADLDLSKDEDDSLLV